MHEEGESAVAEVEPRVHEEEEESEALLLHDDERMVDDVGAEDASSSSEQNRKLFLGGLNYNSDEETLRSYFSSFGQLVDVVVMRFPDSRRSRGFGFVTFADMKETLAALEAAPHTIDGQFVEVKRATPKNELGLNSNSNNEHNRLNTSEGEEPEIKRKIFVGGLSHATTDESLKNYFEKFGELTDCIVMKYRESGRSRGFGFVTFTQAAMVDAVQDARPHSIDNRSVETKRAMPRDDQGGRENTSSNNQTVTRVFVGGVKDSISDEDLNEYFSLYGQVKHVEQVTDKESGRKRGFAFVDFDDHDAVDKAMQKIQHNIKGFRVDVKKAVSKQEMAAQHSRGPQHPTSRGQGNSNGSMAMSPWSSYRQPWGSSNNGGAWSQGGSRVWHNSGWVGGQQQGWDSMNSWGAVNSGGNAGYRNGGPVRNQMYQRSAPYNVGRGGGGGTNNNAFARGRW